MVGRFDDAFRAQETEVSHLCPKMCFVTEYRPLIVYNSTNEVLDRLVHCLRVSSLWDNGELGTIASNRNKCLLFWRLHQLRYSCALGGDPASLGYSHR